MALGLGCDDVIFVPRFVNTGRLAQRLKQMGNTGTEHGDLVNL